MVDPEVPGVSGPGRVGEGLVGHEPGDRLGDESVELGGTGPVRERGHLGVDEPGCFHGQPEGGLGDAAGPPGHQLVGLHPGPDPREAVLQLDRLGHERATGVGGHPERGGELGETELRDQGRTGSGEREAGVAAAGDPGRGGVDRLRRVLLGPGHGGQQDVGLGGVGRGTAVAGETEHVGRGVQLCGRGVPGRRHGAKSTSDHRQFPGPKALLWKGNLEKFADLGGSSTGVRVGYFTVMFLVSSLVPTPSPSDMSVSWTCRV